MRHFEIEVICGGYPFRLCCTTITEALEVIRGVINERQDRPVSFEDLDGIITRLVGLKGTGRMIRPYDYIMISDVEGEV